MMLEAISKCKTGETTVIGKFHGFELLVEKNFLGINYMVLRGKTEYKAELSTSPVGSMVKLENRTGDNAPMTQISLVLEETVSASAERTTQAAAAKADSDSTDPSDESNMDSEGAAANTEADSEEK